MFKLRDHLKDENPKPSELVLRSSCMASGACDEAQLLECTSAARNAGAQLTYGGRCLLVAEHGLQVRSADANVVTYIYVYVYITIFSATAV